MSQRIETAVTDAPAATPFAMIVGDPSAMVCDGDVCYIPGPVVE